MTEKLVRDIKEWSSEKDKKGKLHSKKQNASSIDTITMYFETGSITRYRLKIQEDNLDRPHPVCFR